jgi:clan AA aspartic protease (TIGR02281 family)
MRRALGAGVLAVALLAAAAHAEWSSPDADIPLAGDGSSWLVVATVNGKVRGRFLLDTGASYCVLAPAVARSLALPPTGSAITLQTANGMVRAPVVRLRTLELGTSKAHDLQAIVHDAVGPDVDGIIGLNFLNRFHYDIDPRRHVLHLR